MANLILPIGQETSLAVGIAQSTTVGKATVVRVLSTAGAAVVVRTDGTDGSIIGSFTTLNNSADLVQKHASDFIHVTGNAVKVSKVGFTN